MAAADVNWVFVVLAAVVGLLLLSWPAYRRLLRQSNLLRARGDISGSLDVALRIRRSWLPVAVLARVLNPGHIEAILALLYHELGRPAEALQWTEIAFRGARKPTTRGSLHMIAAMSHAELDDPDGSDHHLCALGILLKTTSGVTLEWHATAISCNLWAGRIERALAEVHKALAGGSRPVSAYTTATTLNALALAGRFHDVFRVVERMMDVESRSDAPMSAGSPDTAEKSLGDDKLRRALERDLDQNIAWVALEAAYRADRWDLFETYLGLLNTDDAAAPRIRCGVLRFRTLWAAHCGARHDVISQLDAAQRISAAHPEDRRLALAPPEAAVEAWQLLGEHEQALAALEELARLDVCPLFRSEHASLAGVSLAALGREQEADEKRTEAVKLAPAACWNQTATSAGAHNDSDDVIDSWVSGGRADTGSVAPVWPDRQPVAPVASGVACAAWIVSVAAMVPVFGGLAAIVLGVLGLSLLFKHEPLKCDRRVGWAVLILAVASLGFTSGILVHKAAIRRARGQPDPVHASVSTMMERTDTTGSNGLAGGVIPASSNTLGESETGTSTDKGEAHSATPDTGRREFPWSQKLLYLAVLIVSIMLHEIGHAVAAHWSGDPTARDLGRFSLNPLRHLDWAGSLIVPVLLLVLPGDAVIGWAKPVPIRPARFRHRRRAGFAVTLAGVSMNLLIAFIAANVLMVLLAAIGWVYPGCSIHQLVYPLTPVMVLGVDHAQMWGAVLSTLKAAVWVNALLAGFNLLPFPPLDGFGVIRALVPSALGTLLDRLAGLGTILLLLLVAFNLLAYMLIPAALLGVILLRLAVSVSG